MQIISLIQGLWVALIILMFFAKLRTGICLYVAYMILVPYMNINLGINLQWNFVNLILFFAFLLYWMNNKGGRKIVFEVYLFLLLKFLYFQDSYFANLLLRAKIL